MIEAKSNVFISNGKKVGVLIRNDLAGPAGQDDQKKRKYNRD